MTFTQAIERVGRTIEALGIGAIVIAVAGAMVLLVRQLLRGDDRQVAAATARRNVGQGMLLGLEVLVAGDVIRTVGVDPSFTSVGVLAGIVAIRTFLSFTIELEVTGRWPWQRPRAATVPGGEIDGRSNEP